MILIFNAFVRVYAIERRKKERKRRKRKLSAFGLMMIRLLPDGGGVFGWMIERAGGRVGERKALSRSLDA